MRYIFGNHLPVTGPIRQDDPTGCLLRPEAVSRRLLVMRSRLKAVQAAQVFQRVFGTKFEVCAGERAVSGRERGSGGDTHQNCFAAPSTYQLRADHWEPP
jgi:hypothetical protein